MARTVWLTFDDGPNPLQTPEVLDALAANGIKATFFMIGNVAEPNMRTAKKVAEAGHIIGNHTHTHRIIKGLPKDQITKEIEDAHAVLKELATYKKWLRPTEGKFDSNVSSVADSLGFEIANWNADTLDWQSKDASKWIPQGISDIKKAGDKVVVINHDIYQSTSRNVQKFIDEIKKLGDVTFGDPANMPLIGE